MSHYFIIRNHWTQRILTALVGSLGIVLLAGTMAGCNSLSPARLLSSRVAVDIQIISESVVVSQDYTDSRFYPLVRYVDNERVIVSASGVGLHESLDEGISWIPRRESTPLTKGNLSAIVTPVGLYFRSMSLRSKKQDRLLHASARWIRPDGSVEEIPDVTVTVENMPEEVPSLTGGQYLAVQGGMYVGNGRMIIIGSGRLNDDPDENPRGHYRLHRRVMIFKSDDGGASFHYWSTVATSKHAPWGNEGANEVDWVQFPGGEILAVMRTGSDPQHARVAYPMLSARSSDGGKTWHSHRRMPKGVFPRIIRLENGILVCTAGRPDNNLIFSLDDGRTWTREYNLDSRHRSSGYMDLAEIAPNRVLVVYEKHGYRSQRFWLWEPPAAQNVVKAVVLDVNRRFGE